MVQLAIRCHPVVPVSVGELEQWLEQLMNDLRREAPLGIIRLSRLAQGPPTRAGYIGWLVELELGEEEPLLVGGGLADVLRDMRLLGLQPTLLAPASSNPGPVASSVGAVEANGARP